MKLLKTMQELREMMWMQSLNRDWAIFILVHTTLTKFFEICIPLICINLYAFRQSIQTRTFYLPVKRSGLLFFSMKLRSKNDAVRILTCTSVVL